MLHDHLLVTLSLLFTPVFYVVMRRLAGDRSVPPAEAVAEPVAEPVADDGKEEP